MGYILLIILFTVAMLGLGVLILHTADWVYGFVSGRDR